MNEVLLVGKLARGVDLRTTDNGADVARFTIKIRKPYKNIDGKYETDYIDCIAWRNLAKNLSEYCKKDDLIGIMGRIQIVRYNDKNGNKVYQKEIVADKITFLANSNKKEEPTTHNEVEIEPVKQEDPFASFGEQYDIDDSQLPF